MWLLGVWCLELCQGISATHRFQGEQWGTRGIQCGTGAGESQAKPASCSLCWTSCVCISCSSESLMTDRPFRCLIQFKVSRKYLKIDLPRFVKIFQALWSQRWSDSRAVGESPMKIPSDAEKYPRFPATHKALHPPGLLTLPHPLLTALSYSHYPTLLAGLHREGLGAHVLLFSLPRTFFPQVLSWPSSLASPMRLFWPFQLHSLLPLPMFSFHQDWIIIYILLVLCIPWHSHSSMVFVQCRFC